MNVLILYATVEGQTGKIARFVEREVTGLGHSVQLANADDTERLDFEGVDAAILAASVHQRRHPRAFEALLAAFRENLAAIPTLMLSVSLNAAFAEGQEEAADYLTEMKMRTGLEPDAELLVPGAVQTGKYDYFAMQVVRFVVLRGRDFEPGLEEYEFTDWEAIRSAVTGFLERCERGDFRPESRAEKDAPRDPA